MPHTNDTMPSLGTSLHNVCGNPPFRGFGTASCAYPESGVGDRIALTTTREHVRFIEATPPKGRYVLELGIFNNLATDLTPVETEQGISVPGGNLEEIHAGAQRAQVNQV